MSSLEALAYKIFYLNVFIRGPCLQNFYLNNVPSLEVLAYKTLI